MMELFAISLDQKLGAMSTIPVTNFVQLKMVCLASILLLDGTWHLILLVWRQTKIFLAAHIVIQMMVSVAILITYLNVIQQMAIVVQQVIKLILH